jgi:hypothetical protein
MRPRGPTTSAQLPLRPLPSLAATQAAAAFIPLNCSIQRIEERVDLARLGPDRDAKVAWITQLAWSDLTGVLLEMAWRLLRRGFHGLRPRS